MVPTLRGGSRSWQGEGHKQTNLLVVQPGSLVSCFIFEAANSHLLAVLTSTILTFADGCEVLKAA